MVERDSWGIAEGFWGTDGQWHGVGEGARRSIRSALGADEHPDGAPGGPPLWFVRTGETPEVWSPGLLECDTGDSFDVTDRLPPDVPLGAHILRSDDGHVTRLFVLAHHAPIAARGWGWSSQLYGTRSRRSWGHGDLRDLADLARWARAGGASMLAHNPLGAAVPVGPQEPSPYFASSRRFWSPLYLNVEGVPGASESPAVAPAARAGRALNRSPVVDRDEVWRLKLAALEEIWARTRTNADVIATLDAAARDDALSRHSMFCLLAEHHGPSWHEWPADVRDPLAPGVEAAAASHVDRIDFWRWVHLSVDQQLADAAKSGAGLMADLPVGFSPGGADAWADQDLLATGCRIGAPPDDLGPLGQDWGLPPYVPWKLRRAAYEPFLDTLRRTMRHARTLRIDHVMGLFRLFWIPPGHDPADGGYVYWPGTELIDLAVMEAARTGTVLVGEDLGTVEDEVRQAMAERSVYGYRVAWFEDGAPHDWPATTLASITTHDLPTVRGLWSGSDAVMRSAAGLQPDPHEEQLLRDRLARLAGLAPDEDVPAREVSLAAHRSLATSGSDLAVATLEDAVDSSERPNLPGTVDEHPNWRVALPVTLEDLDDAGAADLAVVMGEGGRNGTEPAEPVG